MIEFFNGYKNVLMFYKGDYGLPIVYTASEFQIDDEIVFCVSGNVIAPKIFTVDALSPDGTFEFNLSLNASEAQAIATARGAVLWNFKQYRNNHFLETLKTGIFEVKDAVKWQN
ncbi:MAG: hypothetical protein IIZ07_08580 [Ruminococcus sp.]|nr:hypothetical protein [Ruminococcus sp.]